MSETGTITTETGDKLLGLLSNSRRKIALYPPHHEYVRRSVEGLFQLLSSLLRDHTRITLSIIGGDLYLEGRLLPEQSLKYRDLIETFLERGLVNLTFERGLMLDELARFLCRTNEKPEVIEKSGGWQRLIIEDGIQYISVDKKIAVSPNWEPSERGDKARVSKEAYRRVIEAVTSAYADAREQKSLNLEMVNGVVGLLVSTIASSQEALVALRQVKKKDEYTLSHSVNVAILSLLMGSKLQLPGPILYRLGVAALLHDVGKSSVPEEIINKPGKLSEAEWELMQAHTLEGAKVLSEHENMDDLAVIVAAEHHAEEDLTGYPKFHALKKLHMMSKIVAIVDTYDALTSDRSYSRAMLPDRAMKLIIEGAGSHFDRDLLRVFVQLSGMFPIGSCVELDTGENAIVHKANPLDCFRPQIKLIATTASKGTVFRLVDLTEKTGSGEYARTVVCSVRPSDIGVEVGDGDE